MYKYNYGPQAMEYLMSRLILPSIFSSLIFSSLAVNAAELNVYGVAHLSADQLDDGQESSQYLASNSSRLGFNGHYQINTNLKAIFQYETGVDLTAQGGNDGNGPTDSDDSGQLFTKGRPSFVGLSGHFGKVLIGHMPALDQWANDYNLFADQVGDLGNLWEGSGLPGRLDNVIHYATPNFNGFNAALSYVPEEGKDNTGALIFKGDYNKDELKVGLAYASISQSTMSKEEHTVAAVTFSYDFGNFTLGGGYQSEYDILGTEGNDRDSFSIGGSINLGDQGKLKVQVANSSGQGSDNDANLYAIGYDYIFSDNANIYIAYSNMDNDKNVAFSVNGKGHGDKVIPQFGDDPRVLSLGMIYKFNIGLGN
jgi:predicted porin